MITKMLTMVGIVLLTGMAARADVVAIPPKQLTLTGTLGWSTEKRPNGQAARAWLKLTTAEGKEVNLLRAQDVKKPEQYDQFVGKKVVVKVMAHEFKSGRGEPEVRVLSVTDIKDAPATKR